MRKTRFWEVGQMALHSLQFVISRRPVPPICSWKSLRMDDGWWMHCCRALPLSSATTADGRTVLLLGWAFQLSAKERNPEVQLSTLNSDDLVTKYRTWTGRWI